KNTTWSWDLSALLARPDEIAAARANAAAVDLQIAWAEWQVAQDARLRAFRLLSMQTQLPLAREIEEGLGHNIEAIRKALAHGYKTTADLTAATDLLTQARNNRLALEHAITADRLALNIALAIPVEQTLQIKPAVKFPELTTPGDG